MFPISGELGIGTWGADFPLHNYFNFFIKTADKNWTFDQLKEIRRNKTSKQWAPLTCLWLPHVPYSGELGIGTWGADFPLLLPQAPKGGPSASQNPTPSFWRAHLGCLSFAPHRAVWPREHLFEKHWKKSIFVRFSIKVATQLYSRGWGHISIEPKKLRQAQCDTHSAKEVALLLVRSCALVLFSTF
jgi:hypothetical protein